MRGVLVVLALAALLLIAINTAVAYQVLDRVTKGTISTQDYLAYLRNLAFLSTTATLGSFALGVLACTLAVQRRQRGWIALVAGALLISAYVVPIIAEISAAGQQRLAYWLLERGPAAQVVFTALPTGLPALVALLYAIAASQRTPSSATDRPDSGSR